MEKMQEENRTFLNLNDNVEEKMLQAMEEIQVYLLTCMYISSAFVEFVYARLRLYLAIHRVYRIIYPVNTLSEYNSKY